jgi:hypothetical protein
MVHVKGFHQHLLEVVNDRVMGISVTRWNACAFLCVAEECGGPISCRPF